MKDYSDIQKRAIEVCEYNDLGFTIIYSNLVEHDRGYKGEDRDATDTEIYMWERFDAKTPQNPYKEINKCELIAMPKYGTRLTVPEKHCNESKIWVREEEPNNHWNIILYKIEKIGDDVFINEIPWTRVFYYLPQTLVPSP